MEARNYKDNNFSITLNNKMHGIEIRYVAKMSEEQIAEIKDAGFRWSKRQQMWYAYQNDNTISFANNLIANAENTNIKNIDSITDEITSEEIRPLEKKVEHAVDVITVEELAKIIRQRQELDRKIEAIRKVYVNGKTISLESEQERGLFFATHNFDEYEIGKPVENKIEDDDVVLTAEDFQAAKKFLPGREYATLLDNATEGEEQEHFRKKIQHVAEMGRRLYENRNGKSYNNESKLHDKGFMHYFLGESDWYICEVDEDDRAFGYVILNGDVEMSEYGYIDLNELTELGNRGWSEVELDLYIDDSIPMEHAINQKYPGLFSVESENEIEKDEKKQQEPKIIDGHQTPTQIKNIREEAKKILSEHTDEEIRNNPEMLELLAQYEGGGGISNEKDRTSAEVLNAFYTPRSIVNAVWQLADHYAPKAKTVLEPSSGIGRFAENRPNNQFTLRELDETSARIAKILHPDAEVIQGAFQAQFFDEAGRVHIDDVELPKYDIVIGNPPYGENNSIWKGRGEGKNFARIEEYFLDKGLDSLKDENSVLLYVMPSSFLKSGYDRTKNLIASKGQILDAYRLPNGAFDSTDVGTDIIVLKRNASDTQDLISKELFYSAPTTLKPIVDAFSSDNWFKNHPEKILGEEYKTTDRWGKEVTRVRPHEGKTLQDELSEITRQIEAMESSQEQKKVPELPKITYYVRSSDEFMPMTIKKDLSAKEAVNLAFEQTEAEKDKGVNFWNGYRRTYGVAMHIPGHLVFDDPDQEDGFELVKFPEATIDTTIFDQKPDDPIYDKAQKELQEAIDEKNELEKLKMRYGDSLQKYYEDALRDGQEEPLPNAFDHFIDEVVQPDINFRKHNEEMSQVEFIEANETSNTYWEELAAISDKALKNNFANFKELKEYTNNALNELYENSVKEHEKEAPTKQIHELPEEIAKNLNFHTSSEIATNFVLEKLSKAGIEVVTDKTEFDKILANTERLQKMVDEHDELKNLQNKIDEQNKRQEELEKQITLLEQKNTGLILSLSEKTKEKNIDTIAQDFASLDRSLRFNANFEIPSEKLGDEVSVFPCSTGKSGMGIRHLIEERAKKDNLSQDEITALSALVLDSVRNGEITRESDYQAEFTKNGIVAIVRKDYFGEEKNWILTGFSYNEESDKEKNREATEAIQTVIAKYSQSPDYSYFRNQVGAVMSSLGSNISQTPNLSSIKPQNFVQDNVIYGFTYNNKIYLNPDVMNSEAAVHEYTHLWDAYTQRTNPELWQKGKGIFSHTQLWLDIKNDENYADIADDDDLVLSECHARICGKVAAQVLERIAKQDGEITKDKVIDWDKEVSDYLYKELRDLAPEVPGWAIDQKKIEFLAQPMKDLISGRNILQEVNKEQSISSEQPELAQQPSISQKQKGDLLTAEEFSRLYGKDFDQNELPIWKATDWEGKIDLSKLTASEIGSLQKSPNYVETEHGEWTHKVLFTSGDIGAKIQSYKNNYDSADEESRAIYKKNIELLQEVLPNPIPVEKLHFGVNTTLAEEFEIEHRYDDGRTEKLNLQESFILWAAGQTVQSINEDEDYQRGAIDYSTANISREDFPENVSWYDIVEYIDKRPVKTEPTRGWGMDEAEKAAMKAQRKREADEKRMARSETADKLFDRYLHEGLSENDRKAVEAEYNRRFNSYVIPNYSKLPLSIGGMSAFKGDDRFKLYDQQVKGISFLCNKGNGLLAYDVGVGKTAAGIVANENQIQLERSRKPLIVVPNAVYTKWHNDIRELFPNRQIIDLYNLNKESTEKYRDSENPHKLNIPENAVSIITYEGLKNITFTDESCENELYEDYSRLLSENIEDVLDDYRNVTEKAKDSEKIKNAIGAASQVKNNNYVFFEDCGWDNITVDEAHNFKNLWTVPRSKHKGESNEFAGIPSGKPSQRALKLYAMTQLVQRNNNNRNVFLLTATPFTNSPLEVYSMMSYVGRQRLLDSGIYSLRDFLTQFAHTKLEIAVNTKGEIDYKQVMKDWKELSSLQNILTEYIDKVDGEEAGIIRPRKFTHVKDLDLSKVQKEMIQADTDHMLEIKENSAAVIVSMNAMRLALVAPALADKSRYPGIEIPPMEKLVDTSPKLKFVCDSIIDMYKTNPEKGQFMYMPLGQQAHGIVKDYLVAHGIPKDAVEIINGSINNSTEKKEKITGRFNDEKDKLKIIIGGKNTSEGIDLNGNSFVMYNCSLGWNPSETIQAEGRIWRQGNMQGHVHCVYPVMNDSIDSVLYQKHDEKRSRINDLWTYKGDNLNVEDINPEELKFDLIKDPMKRAKLVLSDMTKELKAELSKTELKITSYEEIAEKKIKLKEELEEAQATLKLREKTKEDYEKTNLEVPYWLKTEISSSKKDIKSTTLKLETVGAKLERMGIHSDEESASYLRRMNVQKHELEKQIEMKKEELPQILKKMKQELLEKKILLPPAEEQRKELCDEITSNLRPMEAVKIEIKQERFEKMLELKFQHGEITEEQHEQYKKMGFDAYDKWIGGDFERIEDVPVQESEVVVEAVKETTNKVETKIEAEKPLMKQQEPVQSGLFDEDYLDSLNPVKETVRETPYRLVTFSAEMGFNDGSDFETSKQAMAAGVKFMRDWNMAEDKDGFVTFNTATNKIGGGLGYFPKTEYFSDEVLALNGIAKTRVIDFEKEIKPQKQYAGVEF